MATNSEGAALVKNKSLDSVDHSSPLIQLYIRVASRVMHIMKLSRHLEYFYVTLSGSVAHKVSALLKATCVLPLDIN